MTDITTNETRELLKSYIHGIENLESDKKELAERIKEIYDEIKAKGLCGKTIKKIIADRKKDKAKLEEEKYLLETYLEALGEQSN